MNQADRLFRIFNTQLVRNRDHIATELELANCMSDETRTCPKCKALMKEGFILEQNLTNYVPSVWVEGPPEPSFWTITKVFDKPKKLVVSYRCVQCGYLAPTP